MPSKGKLSKADLIPDAVGLLAVMTGSFLHAMEVTKDRQLALHFQKWVLPILETCLEQNSTKEWAGIIVILLAAVAGLCHKRDTTEMPLNLKGLFFKGEKLSVTCGVCQSSSNIGYELYQPAMNDTS